MLFLSDTIARKRRKLIQQIKNGSLTLEGAFLRAIEFDPFDSYALLAVGTECTKRGDDEQARHYYWRALEADPASATPYILLSVSQDSSDPEFAGSMLYLALLRALSGEGDLDDTAQKWLEGVRKMLSEKFPGTDEEKLHQIAYTFAIGRPDEPEAVTNRLLPYRLIQEVIDRPDEGMDRDIVDEIVELGSLCVPLLIGVLRGWARQDENDPVPAEAAVALLGEIGDESALPAIRECVDAQEPVVTPAARWAMERIASRSTAGQTVYDFCCSDAGEVEAEPEVRPERNDPCWCGSGKKYKKCHLDSDAQKDRGEAQAEDRRISDLLLQFLKDNFRTGEMNQAFKMFFGPAHEMEITEDEQMAFFDWLLNDYVSGRFRRTIPEEYLARNRERLGARDRAGLQEWADSYCSLFEVQRIEKGVGVELKDLLTDGVLFVNDVTSSNSMMKWDCVFTRVRQEGAKTIFTAVGMGITPALCPRVREWIVSDKEASGLEWRPYLRASSHHIRQRCLEFYDDIRSNMRMVTNEGDEFVFGKAVYRILDRERLLKALDGNELIGAREDEGEEVRFAWFETPEKNDDEGRRVLGHLRLEEDRLILECQSRQRLTRGMAMLRKIAGAALEEKLTEFQSPQSMMKNLPPKPSKEPSVSPELQDEVISAFKKKHFQSWPDMALPALMGLTPRQAARDPEVRPRLIALLKQLENSEERDRLEGRGWFDVGRLKAELGVSY